MTDETQGPRRVAAKPDRRTSPFRRLRALRDEMLSSIAGPTPEQRVLAERIAALRASAERQESFMATGDDRFDPKLHARLCGAWLRLAKELHGNVGPAAAKPGSTPRTLEDLAEREGWTLPKAGEDAFGDPLPGNSRFRDAVHDDDDEQDRRDRVLLDQPGIARNAARDRKLAKAGTGKAKVKIARRKIRGAKS